MPGITVVDIALITCMCNGYTSHVDICTCILIAKEINIGCKSIKITGATLYNSLPPHKVVKLLNLLKICEGNFLKKIFIERFGNCISLPTSKKKLFETVPYSCVKEFVTEVPKNKSLKKKKKKKKKKKHLER